MAAPALAGEAGANGRRNRSVRSGRALTLFAEAPPRVPARARSRGRVAATARKPAPLGEPEIAVAIEGRLLRRAVSNLIVNALRHARSRVEVTLERRDGMARVEVHDDGPGVPDLDRERIFEPFQRLDDPRTRTTKGSDAIRPDGGRSAERGQTHGPICIGLYRPLRRRPGRAIVPG